MYFRVFSEYLELLKYDTLFWFFILMKHRPLGFREKAKYHCASELTHYLIKCGGALIETIVTHKP